MKSSPPNDIDLADLQRLADIGRLSATLLHEISNPLSAAIIRLEDNKHNHACIRLLRRDINRLNRYLQSARAQIYRSGEKGSFSLSSQVISVKRVITPLAKQAGVRVIFKPATRLRLIGDPIKFQQIMVNLILNAIEAYDNQPQGPRTVLVEFKDSPRWLYVSVLDWGKGINKSELAKLFQPFYSTKVSRRPGLGIGLTIVRDYVRHEFNGLITVSSHPLQGTRFTLKLKH